MMKNKDKRKCWINKMKSEQEKPGKYERTEERRKKKRENKRMKEVKRERRLEREVWMKRERSVNEGKERRMKRKSE